MTEEIYELDLDWDFASHLADPQSFAIIRAEGVTEALINDEYVQEIFRWQKAHYRQHGKPATASALEATFEELGVVEPLTAIGDLIHRLRERYLKNEGREAIREIAEAYKEDPSRLVEEMGKKARELARLTVGKGDAWGTGDHDRSIQEYHKHVLRGEGPSFGFKELDDYFYGQRGITFMLGAPKSMKTWIALNAVYANVLKGNTSWLYSLELPAYEANMRLRCLAANIPWWRFLKGRLSKSDIAAMAEAASFMDESGLFRIISPPIGERDTQKLVQDAIDGGADVVFIDQLQYLQDRSGVRLGDGNQTGSYWGVGDDLRELSYQVPITVIHQFNRSVMNSDSMPAMQQAKASSMIEEVATLVLGLHANKDMRNSGILEFGTLATRNYGLASWELAVTMNDGCNFEVVGRVEDE